MTLWFVTLKPAFKNNPLISKESEAYKLMGITPKSFVSLDGVRLDDVQLGDEGQHEPPITQSPTVTPAPTLTPVPEYTPVVVVSTPTPEPTATNVPYETFRLSFYDPNIGKYFPDNAFTNCFDWDPAAEVCRSTTASGYRHEEFYGRGLACPDRYPLGTVFRVLRPVQLAGDWYCIDRGGAITDDWLDFLLQYPDGLWTGANINDFPWGTEVRAEVYYP